MMQDIRFGYDIKQGYFNKPGAGFFGLPEYLPIYNVRTVITSGVIKQVNIRVGYEGQSSNNEFSIIPRIIKSNDKIGRGVSISDIGDSGNTFDVQFSLFGRSFQERNKIYQLLKSSEAFEFYEPSFQTLNSAGQISSINKNPRFANKFYVKCVQFDLSTSEEQSNANNFSCKLQEVKYDEYKSNSKFNKIIDFGYQAYNALQDVNANLEEAQLHLESAINVIINTTQTIQNLGLDFSSFASTTKQLITTIPTLLNSPSDLVNAMNGMATDFISIFNVYQNNSNDITEISNSRSLMFLGLSGLIDFTVPKKVKTNTVGSTEYLLLTNIRDNIVAGKIVLSTRLLGFIVLISLISRMNFTTLQDVEDTQNFLENAYEKLYFDNSYDGLQSSESTASIYTNTVINRETLTSLAPLYYQAIKYLRDIRASIQNASTVVLPISHNLLTIIYTYYNTILTFTNLNLILRYLFLANNLNSYLVKFNAGSEIILPDMTLYATI